MRVLRSTMYRPPERDGFHPVTIVIREPDLSEPMDKAMEAATKPLPSPAFIVAEVFIVPDGTSIERATFEAHRRQQERSRAECDMAIGFFWYLGWFLRMTEGGVIGATKPAPLEVDDLEAIARQLAKEPSYRRQTVRQIARDGRFVVLADGKVTVEAIAR